MATKKQTQVSLYEIKITLLGAEPAIWRRVTVPRDITLASLHDVIQVAMGWEDEHPHDFLIKRKSYGPLTEFSLGFGDGPVDEAIVPLNEVVRTGSKFRYTYDFGDSWHHEVVVERQIASPGEQRRASCVAGENACPPEDCGGVWGYSDMLAVLANPQHEDYEEMREWVDEDFDPCRFDVAEADRRLALLPL